MSKHTAVMTILIITMTALGAQAQERPEDWQGDEVDGRQPVAKRYRHNLGRAHDRGPLVRGTLGTTYHQSDVAGLLNNQGMTLDGGVEAGWLPFERVGVHAGMTGWLTRDRKLLAAQLGATYFFEDVHVYTKLAMGPAAVWDQRAVDRQLADANAPAGLALTGEAAVGKLWWTGRHWSMGLAIAGGIHGADLDGDGTTFGGWRAGLRVEVLYN